MDFLTLLIIAFLAYIAYVAYKNFFRPIFRAAMFYRNLKKTINRNQNPGGNNRGKQSESGNPQQKRKIFSKNDGEYTSFEEINITSSSYTETIPDNGTVVNVESQTVDVEWEDI